MRDENEIKETCCCIPVSKSDCLGFAFLACPRVASYLSRHSRLQPLICLIMFILHFFGNFCFECFPYTEQEAWHEHGSKAKVEQTHVIGFQAWCPSWRCQFDQFDDKSNHEDCKDDNSNYEAFFMNIILKMAMEKRK